MEKQDTDVSEVTNEMLKTLKVLQNKFNSQVPEAPTSVNYTSILKQVLNKVPSGYEDDCLIHVLNDLEEFNKMHALHN